MKARVRDLFVREPQKLKELIRLREQGKGSPWLGQYFDVDQSTIRYTLVRFAPHLVGPRPKNPNVTRKPRVRGNAIESLERRMRALREKRQISEVVRPLYRTRAKDWVGRIERDVARLYVEIHGVPEEFAPETPPPPKPRAPAEKYAHLIDEEFVQVNRGKSYAAYRNEGLQKTKALRATRSAQLEQEYQDRVARRGTLLSAYDKRKFIGNFMKKTNIWPRPKV